MSYVGENKFECTIKSSSYSSLYLVVVSGDSVNFCGHALLYASNGKEGNYYHILGLRKYPWVLSDEGFLRYKRENRKTELKRVKLFVPNVMGTVRHLERALVNRWRFGLLINNCYTFIEEAVKAGGGNISLVFNCPINGDNQGNIL